MKLIKDWRQKLNKLWSIRLALFTALLGAADPILSSLVGTIPPAVYASLSIAVVLARVIHQS